MYNTAQQAKHVTLFFHGINAGRNYVFMAFKYENRYGYRQYWISVTFPGGGFAKGASSETQLGRTSSRRAFRNLRRTLLLGGHHIFLRQRELTRVSQRNKANLIWFSMVIKKTDQALTGRKPISQDSRTSKFVALYYSTNFFGTSF